MSEAAIKSNQRQAQQLFERGAGAAKGGQRRVAAGLLGRAVQLDPQHEQAWLWLSGVVDDPKQVAFCLRSVLAINPHNERARQGLVWLDQHASISAQPVAHNIGANVDVRVNQDQEPARAAWWINWRRNRNVRMHEDQEPIRAAWWIGWRRNRREMSRAWQFVLSGIILFLLLTLLLNRALHTTVQQNQRQTRAALLALTPTAAPLDVRPTVVPVLQTDLLASEDARVIAYISAMKQPREQLQQAVQTYRDATQKLGDSAVAHAAAARAFRDQVEAAHTTLVEVVPPPPLQRAHRAYLAGLGEERQAMDDMLKFYGSFSVQFANSATLRMIEAGRHFERARADLAQVQAEANTAAHLFVQTAR